MKERLAAAFVLLAAAVPGLLFAPVFGLWALVPCVAGVLAACYLTFELCLRVPALLSWRPLIALILGLLAVVWTELAPTTAGGVPTGSTVRALADGVTKSWQLTLQSTWPARPDAQLILFIPLAVLIAAVLSIELIRWAPAALAPSLVLVGLSQAYLALTGRAAVLAALGYAVVAAALLVVSRDTTAPDQRATRRAGAVVVVAPTVVLGVLAALLITVADPVTPSVSLRQNQSVPLPPARVTNPLDEIAARTLKPDDPVFSYRADAPVDRWRMVVLDQFDGVTWSSQPDYRRMGSTVAPTGSSTVPATSHSAAVDYTAVDQPWLPSQALPDAVSGVAPLIDLETGELRVTGQPGADQPGAVHYQLSWREPVVDADDLDGRAIDSNAESGFNGVGAIPPRVSALASDAVGKIRPSMQTALVLSRFLAENYHLATGTDLPTGAGWPQLQSFLLTTKRGTSEQFAAAYVVLARAIGIPARLVVGYRGELPGPDGAAVVHNRDVLAWPEVAVAGVGWVPLDPTETASGSGAASSGLAAAAAKARNALPPQQELQDPKLPPAAPAADGPKGGTHATIPWLLIGIIVLALLVVALLVVPVLKLVRGWRRRRLRGAKGVVAAWTEARDQLRAHGVAVTSGMTVRELAAAAAPLGEPVITVALTRLAELVDAVLWSGGAAPPDAVASAWAAVREVRRGLAGRPARQRIRAALHLDSLRPLGLPTVVGSRASAGRLPA